LRGKRVTNGTGAESMGEGVLTLEELKGGILRNTP